MRRRFAVIAKPAKKELVVSSQLYHTLYTSPGVSHDCLYSISPVLSLTVDHCVVVSNTSPIITDLSGKSPCTV